MDPFRDIPTGELGQVIQVAARLHGEARARAERDRLRLELLAAAAEVGLTEEQLRHAAAIVRQNRRRLGARRRWGLAVATAGLTWGACGTWALCRSAAPAAQPVFALQPADAGWVQMGPVVDQVVPDTPAQPPNVWEVPGVPETTAPSGLDAVSAAELREARSQRETVNGWVKIQPAPDAPGDGGTGR